MASQSDGAVGKRLSNDPNVVAALAMLYAASQRVWRGRLRWAMLLLAIVTCGFVYFTTLLLTLPSSSLEDLLINQGLLPVPQGPLQVSTFSKKGLLEMKRSSVIILGVAKNVEAKLPKVLPQIESLGALFQSSSAIFVEGDSSDETWKRLNDWAKLSPHNRTILQTSAAGAQDTIGTFHGKPLPREGRIAMARNLGLSAMREQRELTALQNRKLIKTGPLLAPSQSNSYVIVLDMDIVGFQLTGVMDSFGRSSWDVMCAQGVLLYGLYRDTYAFRYRHINTNHHLGGNDHAVYNITREQRDRNRVDYLASKQKVLAMLDSRRYGEDYWANLKPIALNSCFGGLAIYRAEVFENNCSYAYRYKSPPYMVDCEHVHLHRCLRSTLPSMRIFTNPHMKLWYGHSDSAVIWARVQRLWRQILAV